MRATFRVASLLAVAIGLAACVSPEDRQPGTDVRVADDFAAAQIRDVAVLPVRNDDPADRMPDEDAAFTFPEAAAREQMRAFLIRSRDYATPRSAWVDERGGVELKTDATLQLVIERWDATKLTARGTIYATGSFVLAEAGTNRELWRYDFSDLPLDPRGPYGGFAAERNMLEAAELLVRDGLMRLPKKS